MKQNSKQDELIKKARSMFKVMARNLPGLNLEGCSYNEETGRIEFAARYGCTPKAIFKFDAAKKVIDDLSVILLKNRFYGSLNEFETLAFRHYEAQEARDNYLNASMGQNFRSGLIGKNTIVEKSPVDQRIALMKEIIIDTLSEDQKLLEITSMPDISMIYCRFQEVTEDGEYTYESDLAVPVGMLPLNLKGNITKIKALLIAAMSLNRE